MINPKLEKGLSSFTMPNEGIVKDKTYKELCYMCSDGNLYLGRTLADDAMHSIASRYWSEGNERARG